METIDDIVKLHEEIKSNLKLELEHGLYQLKHRINNYYVLNEPLYIEYIKDNICKRKMNKVQSSNEFSIILLNSAAMGFGFVSIITADYRFIIFAAATYAFSKYLSSDTSGKRNIEYAQKLKNIPIETWEKVLNRYEKEYLELIK